MRIGIYNRHWPTMGGGERFGGGIAEALKADHDVELLSENHVDLGIMAERLQLDLDGVRLRILGGNGRAVTEASEEYDLFVNVSYLSSDPSRASLSMYVVHFPGAPIAPLTGWKGRLARTTSRLLAPPATVTLASGFHAPDLGRWRRATWTDGCGEIVVHHPADRGSLVLTIAFGRQRPSELGATEVTLQVDGSVVARPVVEPPRSERWRPAVVRVPLRPRSDGSDHRVLVQSGTFHPSELGRDDPRRLGVPVVGVSTSSRLRAWAQRTAPPVLTYGPTDFVRTYTSVVANSEYTSRFVKSWWGVDADVLYPPVTMQLAGDKEQIILSVGRFFKADRGHSKKQLEMVQAFRRLTERGLDGWSLHLVGGCSPSDESYLRAVEAESDGLPVAFHVDASGDELRSLYARASVFWSATGFGEDVATDPGRFEHFGITTVEAMSAGAVPVVVEGGGQVEIVSHGVDGYCFSTIDELVSVTLGLAQDERLRHRVGQAAADRARYFAMPRFAERLRSAIAAVERSP